eukprot:1105425-Rhodomonas_salina.1
MADAEPHSSDTENDEPEHVVTVTPGDEEPEEEPEHVVTVTPGDEEPEEEPGHVVTPGATPAATDPDAEPEHVEPPEEPPEEPPKELEKFVADLKSDFDNREMIRGFEAINGQQYLMHFAVAFHRASLLNLSTLEIFALQNEVATTNLSAAPLWKDFLKSVLKSKHIRVEREYISVCMQDTVHTGGTVTTTQYTAFCRLGSVGTDTRMCRLLLNYINKLFVFSTTLQWDNNRESELECLEEDFPQALPFALSGGPAASAFEAATVEEFQVENFVKKLKGSKLYRVLKKAASKDGATAESEEFNALLEKINVQETKIESLKEEIDAQQTEIESLKEEIEAQKTKN